MADLVYKSAQCSLCGYNFKTPRVKKKAQRAVKTDTDFCVHYSSENPIYYYVTVCPNCGYSYTDSFGRPRKGMQEEIPHVEEDFLVQRDERLAEEAYLRAIKCAELQREKSAVLAGLYLHLAWVYRFMEEKEKEKEALKKAYEYYYDTYQTSYAGDTGRILYLMGELNRRLGNYKDAVFFLAKVASDRTIGDPALSRMARDVWQKAREEYKEVDPEADEE